MRYAKLWQTDQGRWCVAWRTSNMRAPSFWYFDSLMEALQSTAWQSAESRVLAVIE